jgi:tetratricopeptide (TPR) repeat protein
MIPESAKKPGKPARICVVLTGRGLTRFFAVHYTGRTSGHPARPRKGFDMRLRFSRLAVFALVAGVAASACGKYSISNIRSLKAFQDANALYQKAEYQAAIARYEAAIAHNPDESNSILGFAYFFLGNSYDNLYKPARRGETANDANLTKAVEYYEKAIQQLEGSGDEKGQFIRQRAYEYLIQAYGPDKLNDFDRAVPVARQLIAMQPDEPAFYQALAKMYQNEGDFAEAEKLYLQAIDVRPNDPIGFQILAGYYNDQGEFEKTIEAFRKRADLEPNNPEAWHVIGTYYQDKAYRDKTLPRATQVDYTMKGIEAENRALSINADYVDALVIKNILLRMQGNFERDLKKRQQLYDEADRLLSRATELQSKQNATAGAGRGSAPAAGSGGS